MNRTDIQEPHFITYIDNLPSILKLGIISRNKAIRDKVQFRCIAEPGVQDRRKKKIPGTSKELHDYANLYFDAHNPMLSKRRSENDEICVLRISRDVLDLPGVIVTDKNAARECWFKPVDQGLSLLDADEIYATFWIDRDDPINEYRRAGIKCAEILVLDCLNSRYIMGAYTANQIALEAVKQVSSLEVEINSGLFF